MTVQKLGQKHYGADLDLDVLAKASAHSERSFSIITLKATLGIIVVRLRLKA